MLIWAPMLLLLCFLLVVYPAETGCLIMSLFCSSLRMFQVWVWFIPHSICWCQWFVMDNSDPRVVSFLLGIMQPGSDVWINLANSLSPENDMDLSSRWPSLVATADDKIMHGFSFEPHWFSWSNFWWLASIPRELICIAVHSFWLSMKYFWLWYLSKDA